MLLINKIRPVVVLVVTVALLAPVANAAGLQAYNLSGGAASALLAGDAELIQVENRRWVRPNGPRTDTRREDSHGSESRRDWMLQDKDQRRPRADRDRDWTNDRDGDRPRYKRGHRGEREYRRGYRQDNDGWWYPLAAFAAGAIILNQHNNSQTRNDNGGQWNHIPAQNMGAHDNWCDNRYRSYSRSSKTFQPYNGPRRYCNSPYDRL